MTSILSGQNASITPQAGSIIARRYMSEGSMAQLDTVCDTDDSQVQLEA